MNELAWIWMVTVQSVVTLITVYLLLRVMRRKKAGNGSPEDQ